MRILLCIELIQHCTAVAMEPNGDTEHCLMIEQSAQQTMQIDPKRARFPCCVVWTPLPVISWLIPFIGHIGICREDGVILDFAGPNFVCVDNFAFGAVARYIQISKEKVLFEHLFLNYIITSLRVTYTSQIQTHWELANDKNYTK